LEVNRHFQKKWVKLLLDDDEQWLDKNGVKPINTNLLKKNERLDFQNFPPKTSLADASEITILFGGVFQPPKYLCPKRAKPRPETTSSPLKE